MYESYYVNYNFILLWRTSLIYTKIEQQSRKCDWFYKQWYRSCESDEVSFWMRWAREIMIDNLWNHYHFIDSSNLFCWFSRVCISSLCLRKVCWICSFNFRSSNLIKEEMRAISILFFLNLRVVIWRRFDRMKMFIEWCLTLYSIVFFSLWRRLRIVNLILSSMIFIFRSLWIRSKGLRMLSRLNVFSILRRFTLLSYDLSSKLSSFESTNIDCFVWC